MKTKIPLQVIGLSFQVDHNNPKKNQLHQEDRVNTSFARLFMIIIRHRKPNMISDGKKIPKVLFV